MKDIQSTETKLLKAEKTALVAIDLQNGIVNRQRDAVICTFRIHNNKFDFYS